MDEETGRTTTGAVTRRNVIKAGAIAGGAVWVAPVIDSFLTRAAAASSAPNFVCSVCTTGNPDLLPSSQLIACGSPEPACFCITTSSGACVCAAAFYNLSGPGGGSCASDADCTTTYGAGYACKPGGFCVPFCATCAGMPTGVCTCAGYGATCTDDSQCCSGKCVAGLCASYS